MGNLLDRALSGVTTDQAVLLFIIIPTVGLVAFTLLMVRIWYVMRIRQWEMSLKHTMLERGMSVEEIKSVLEASSSKHSRKIPFPIPSHCASKSEQAC